MGDPRHLRQVIVDRLSTVIDPETGIDVIRMRLIEDQPSIWTGSVLQVPAFVPPVPVGGSAGERYPGRHREVDGVTGQRCRSLGTSRPSELTVLIRQAFKDREI
jgi:hypothetical protein